MAGVPQRSVQFRLCGAFAEALTGVAGGWRGGTMESRQSGVGMMLLIRKTKAASPSQGGKIKVPAPTFTSQKASLELKAREAESQTVQSQENRKTKLFSEESPEAWVSPTCQMQ